MQQAIWLLSWETDENRALLVIFGWNRKSDFCYVNRSETVTNLQGRMEVYRLEQVSKIFAKSVWGILRAVFDSKLARLT